MWEVFRTDLFDLWLCSPVFNTTVSSYGHVGKFAPQSSTQQSAAMVMLGSFLLLWDLSATWSFVSRAQHEQVNVEEIDDGPFTLAWRSMHFLSVLQILYSFTPT